MWSRAASRPEGHLSWRPRCFSKVSYWVQSRHAEGQPGSPLSGVMDIAESSNLLSHPFLTSYPLGVGRPRGKSRPKAASQFNLLWGSGNHQ